MSATHDLAELRHELRTPINHILGFSEMLAEDAPGTPFAAYLPLLNEARQIGNDLLGLVNEGLGPTRTETTDDNMQRLGRSLVPPLARLLEITDHLRGQATGPAMAAVYNDLTNVRTAGERMLKLADERLTHAGEAPVSEADSRPVPANERDLVPRMHILLARRYRVLVVDDIRANRDLLVRRLEREGYRVAEAADGIDALDRIRTEPFDLVLLDVMLPGLTGTQVLEAAKADPATRDLPVIMISALDALESVVRCIDRGAEDYLTKPFNPTVLRARVFACLEKKRLRDLELEYLRGVAAVAEAAEAVEHGRFDPDSLSSVASRDDALGQLARVFQKMAREVGNRVQALQQEVLDLRVKIDSGKRSSQVAEITETGYFQALQAKANSLRRSRRDGP